MKWTQKFEHYTAYFAFLIIALVILTLFVENFLFSQGLSLLRFREIDDLAFQIELRKIHDAICAGQISNLFMANGYAYGWIFWMPLAVLTFPFYLLSSYFSVDWPLIILPRQVSLLFGVLTLVVVNRMLLVYQVPRVLRWGGLMWLTLSIGFGYFSLRFGTVNQVMFFSALAAYLAVRKDQLSSADLVPISTALAIAIGTKLTGFFIAPFVVLCCLTRLKVSSGRELIAKIRKPFIWFILQIVFFTNPSLFIAPFKSELWDDYKYRVSVILKNVNASRGGTLYESWRDGIFGGSFPPIIMLLLFFGLIYLSFFRQGGKERRDSMSATLTLILASVYLVLRVKMDTISIVLYFTGVSFLLLLGLIPIRKIRFAPALVIIGFLLGSYRLSLAIADSPINHHLSYYAKVKIENQNLETSEKLMSCLGSSLNEPSLRVANDWTVPLALNILSHPHICSIFIWDNFSNDLQVCGQSPDFIILDKDRPASRLLNEKTGTKLMNLAPSLLQTYERDNLNRERFLAGYSLDHGSYELACQHDRFLVFSKKR